MMKTKHILATAFVALFAFSAGISGLPLTKHTASAGSSSKVILDDTKAFNTSRPLTESWYVKGSRVEYATNSNAIVWKKDSDVEDALVFRTMPAVTEWDGVVLSVEASFTINEIVGDKMFGIYVGVPRLDFDADDATNTRYRGATYAYVEKGADDTYYAGVKYFGETEIDLVENVPLGANSTIHFSIEQYDGGRLTVFGGTGAGFNSAMEIYDSDDYNAEVTDVEDIVVHDVGLFAMGGRGAYTSARNYHSVTFSHVNIINNYESTPANFNAYETFDADYVNGENWTIGGRAYIGNGMFNFVNGDSNTSIRTKHYFSNFELSFDIPYIQREPIYNEKGEKVQDSCHRFIIIFGVNADSPDACTSGIDALSGPKGYDRYAVGFYPAIGADGYSQMTSFFHGESFAALKYVNLGTYATGSPEEVKHALFNPVNDGRTYCVRIRMVDGILQTWVKWSDELEYTMIFNQDIGYTREGYVQFYCGINNDQLCTLSLDNLRIVNLDSNPRFAEAGFSKSGYPNEGDYIWVDDRNPNDLLAARVNKSQTGNGCVSSLKSVGAVGFVLIALGLVVYKSKKEDFWNEN